MSEQRFDDLTKAFAAPMASRRKFLGGLVAATAALVAPRAAPALSAPGGGTCANEGQSCTAQQCCAGLNCLVDATSGTDKFCCIANVVCQGKCCPTGSVTSCISGKCECPPGETACIPDPSNPAGKCVNLQTDVQNCGGCGKACPEPTGTDAPCLVAACVNGTCAFVPKTGLNLPCEDGDVCTLGDTCDNGTCKPGPIKTCGQCLTCADVGGVATCVPDATKDGNTCQTSKCLLGETCSNGVCQGGTPKDCSDNNECTADSCDETTGNCVHKKLTGTPCETGNKCTADVCNDGACKEGPLAVTCPQCQACDPTSGTCKAAFEGLPCEDGDVCTLGDTCQNGTCKPGNVKQCGQCEVCANVGGVATCVPDTSKNGQQCNDNNACTTGETCQNGLCTGGAPVNCDDKNECTEDTCDPATGCVHTKLTGTACETGNKCTADVCDNGTCKQGPLAVTCSQCNVCDPDTGTCKAVLNDTPCEDGDVCTLGDTCQNGTCKPGNVKQCGQCEVCANVGGVATCVPDTSKNGQQCNDNNACTTGETCQNGLCTGGAPVNCDDKNECTTDTCDPATGCVHTKLTGTACETGNKCTTDTCDNGTCKQGPVSVTCPQCQACDPASGTCKPASEGVACDDGNACTTGEKCQSGVCTGGTVKTCPSGQTCAPTTGKCECTVGVTCGNTCCAVGEVCCIDATGKVTKCCPSGSICEANTDKKGDVTGFNCRKP